MGTTLQDLRYAARSLRRQPGFTAVVVFTLAVGIGANTAIYSLVDATLLRSLPFQEPDRLMKVSLTVPATPGRLSRIAADDMVWSYPKYETFRKSQDAFQDTAVYRATNFNLTSSGQPDRLLGEIVGGAYFDLLGVKAVAGRTFLQEEDVTAGKDFVAVISHDLWVHRFGSDPGVLRQTISLDGRPHQILGVVPAGFQGLTGPADVWVPVHTLSEGELSQPWSHSWSLVARLKPGVSLTQAEAAVTLLGKQINAAFPDSFMHGDAGWGAKARPLDATRLEPSFRQAVLVLFGAVSFVLLIACANIANLLMARGAERHREVAIRLAVGANRARLVRQFLTESILLGALGGLASIAMAYAGVRALAAVNPGTNDTFTFGHRLPGLTVLALDSIRLDGRALLFTFFAALVTGLLFGILPAVQGSRADLTSAMKGGGRASSVIAGRSVLVVAEVCLAVVLLSGAGLMIKSFGRLIATRSGVDPENVLTVRVSLPEAFAEHGGSTTFFTSLEQRIAGLPGVVSAGASNCHPLAGGCNGTIILFPDRPPVPRGSEPGIGVEFVTPGYFVTLKIPLLRGRWFAAGDRQGSPKVAVVSETAARRFWPGEDPIGKPIGIGMGGFDKGVEVIGIVGDVRYGQMDEAPRPEVYISCLQTPRSTLVLYARTSGNPEALAAAVRQQVQDLNRDVPVYDIKTMTERIRDATSKARFSAVLLAVFAGIALVLAAVGIYGVMSYLVTQRTREIGIRIAMGATPREVLSMVVRRGAVLALSGIAAGTAAALAATRVLATLLYGVKPGDPATYAAMAALLAVVALIASYVPARRASAIDPSSALRME
jgi:putative ABC transport system permease protein